jgi:hypothetical protein
MDQNLSPDEQILRATREALKDEVARRKVSEEELRVLYKDIAHYIYDTNSHNQTIVKAELRAKEYLRKIGIIK